MPYDTPSTSVVERSPLAASSTPTIVCPSCGGTMKHFRTIPKLGVRKDHSSSSALPAKASIRRKLSWGRKGASLGIGLKNRSRVTTKRCFFRIGELMRIRIGCELRFEFPQTTPMIVTLNVHFSRVSELERPDYLITNPAVPIEGYRDSFGNWCSRLVAPGGNFSLGTDAIIRDSGVSDPIDLYALQHKFSICRRKSYCFCLAVVTVRPIVCPTRLGGSSENSAWWATVQAICDFVHNHIVFGYEHSRATRRRSKHTKNAAGFAATTRILQSPSAVA